MNIVIRPMKITDVDVVVRIEEALGRTNWSHDLFTGEFKMPPEQRIWLVAQHEGQVVGFGGATMAAPVAQVLNFGVAEQSETGHRVCAFGRANEACCQS